MITRSDNNIKLIIKEKEETSNKDIKNLEEEIKKLVKEELIKKLRGNVR
tara:strand:+ start:1793 stop:1939 length:147 start_codon:yes stop_codon:yes gene_type:complete